MAGALAQQQPGEDGLGTEQSAQYVEQGHQRGRRGLALGADGLADARTGLDHEVGAHGGVLDPVGPAAGVRVDERGIDPCEVPGVQAELGGLARRPVVQEDVGPGRQLPQP